MKLAFSFIFLLLATGGVRAQEMSKESRDEMFKREISKANWVLVTKDRDDIPYYVDTVTMKRFLTSVVVFLIKSERKDSVEYTKNLGGCTKHIMATDNRMFSKPGEKTLKGGSLENPGQVELEPGSINYTILEYVCKNAKEMDIDKKGR